MKRTLITFALLTLPAVAHADEADDHFKRGVELAEKGQAPDAEEAFEKAWALRKAWDIAGNLGLSEAAQGKWTEAAEHLEYAVTHMGSLASEDHKKGLEERYQNVIGRVAKIAITATPADATVKVGEREHSAKDAIFVPEGTVELAFSAEGYEPATRSLTVKKGETTRVEMELKKKAGGAVTPPKGDAPVWPAVVLGVGGGVFIAGGVGMLVGAFVTRSDVEEQTASGTCATDPACQDHEDSLDTANVLGALGITGLGVGAAALAGMGIYLAVGGGGSGDEAAPPPVAIRVRGMSLSIEGSFQ